MVASPHEAERFGLTIMIDNQRDMQVVAQSGSVEDTAKLLLKHHPDITLIDACLVEPCVAAAFKILRQEQPECRILTLAIYEADQVLQRALQAGADGYILKGLAHAELLEAIRGICPEHVLEDAPARERAAPERRTAVPVMRRRSPRDPR